MEEDIAASAQQQIQNGNTDVGRQLEHRHRGDTTYNSHGSLALFRLLGGSSGVGKRHFLSSEPWILWAAEASLPSNIAPLPVSGAKNLVDSMREMPRVESAMLRR